MKGSDLHPKDRSFQTFTDTPNKGWGAHLEKVSTKGLWSYREERLHINVLELKVVYLALQRFKDQCQNQTVLVATDNSTVIAYINKQRETHSAEMCALLCDLVPSLPDNPKSQTHSGMDIASTCNQTDLSKVVHSSCRSVCHSSEPSYVSPVTDRNAWDVDALNINWLGLTAYAYPSMALLYRLIQKKNRQCSHHCNCPRPARDALVLGPSAALHIDPTSVTSVNDTPQTALHPGVSQQSSGFNAWCLRVNSSKNQASLWK